MQELIKQEDLVKKGTKVSFYEYGRAGSQTTIALENFISELEGAYRTFLTSTGFGSIALAIMSICRPGDEIVVTDAVYAPTRMITSKLLKEFGVKTHFYNPENLKSLKSKKITKKQKCYLLKTQVVIHLNSKIFQKLLKLQKKIKLSQQ